MAIITIDQLTGLFRVSQNRHNEGDLQIFLDTYEKQYLQDLLGCDLYVLFVDDLDASDPQVPQTAPYLDIYNAFCEDESSHCGIIRSHGMVDMMLGFLYWEWLRYDSFKKTASGTVISDTENSNHARTAQYDLYVKYNRSVGSYQAIQYKISLDSVTYPDFNGIIKNVNGPL